MRRFFQRLPMARILKWAVVGVLFMGFNLPFLYLLVDCLHLQLLVATLIATLVGTLLRFLVNDRFVFQHPAPTWARLRAYVAANAFSLVLWYAVANVLPHFGLHYLLAAITATACSVGCSLATNFLWVWRQPPGSTDSAPGES